jgi:hypothetical protein
MRYQRGCVSEVNVTHGPVRVCSQSTPTSSPPDAPSNLQARSQLKSRRRDISFCNHHLIDSHPPPRHHGEHQTQSPLVLQVRTMHPRRARSVPPRPHWDYCRHQHEDWQSQVVGSLLRAGPKPYIPTLPRPLLGAPPSRVRTLARP